jgi:hypothetical protein
LIPGYKDKYKVVRNVVTDYGADNTGQKDASSAIQTAIRGKLLLSMYQYVLVTNNSQTVPLAALRVTPTQWERPVNRLLFTCQGALTY